MWRSYGWVLAALGVGCEAPSEECFVAGTLILTPDGKKPIESLEVGQTVWSFAHDKGLVARTITAVHRHRGRVICRVTVADACVRGVTPSHPMYDAANDRYTALRDLNAGSRLLLFLDGEWRAAPIDHLQIEEAPEPIFEIYNLTVEGPEHNYIADGVLVHNKSRSYPTNGEICGDGVVEMFFEQCDDGDRINGDGCSTDCRFDGVVGLPWGPTGGPVPEHCVQTVVFADPVLERAVRAAVARPDGEIPYAEASQLQVLAVMDEPVTDLGGVECLSALRSIAFASGSISDLEPLSDLVLSRLMLPAQLIEDLTPLAGQLGMQYLDIQANRVTDLSPLSSMQGLQALDAGDNRISDVAVLVSLSQLARLSVPGNLIDDAQQLSALHPYDLDISRNSLSDLSSLADLEGVRYLIADENGIESLEFLAAWDPQAWSDLLALSLRDNGITDLAPLVSASWLDGTGHVGGVTLLLDGNPIDCATQADNLAALRSREIRIDLTCSGQQP